MDLSKSVAGIALALVFTTSPVRDQQAQSISPQTAPIQLFVTVTNNKGFVSGLTQSSFQVFVDKDPAKIITFKDSDPDASIGILVDFSGSMPRLGFKSSSSSNLSIIQKALAKFFELNSKTNDYFLVAIKKQPELLVDWTSDTTAIMKMIGDVQPRGGTALYDASRFGIEKLQQGRHSKRILILISDGNDNSSRYTFNDLLKLIRESGVLLYSMNVRNSADAGSALGFEGIAILEELTTTSGGLGYAPATLNQSDADEVLQAIAAEIRRQYTLGIEPSSQLADGKFHKVKVDVNPPIDAPREMKKLAARTRRFLRTAAANKP